MGDIVMQTKWGWRGGGSGNHSIFILSSSYLNLVPGYHLTVTANLM